MTTSSFVPSRSRRLSALLITVACGAFVVSACGKRSPAIDQWWNGDGTASGEQAPAGGEEQQTAGDEQQTAGDEQPAAEQAAEQPSEKAEASAAEAPKGCQPDGAAVDSADECCSGKRNANSTNGKLFCCSAPDKIRGDCY